MKLDLSGGQHQANIGVAGILHVAGFEWQLGIARYQILQ